MRPRLLPRLLGDDSVVVVPEPEYADGADGVEDDTDPHGDADTDANGDDGDEGDDGAGDPERPA